MKSTLNIWELCSIVKNSWSEIKKKESHFFKGELHYLGPIISGKGFYPLPEKSQNIKDLPVPKVSKKSDKCYFELGIIVNISVLMKTFYDL